MNQPSDYRENQHSVHSIEHLISLLGSEKMEVCLQAAYELSQLGEPAIRPLLNALRNKDTWFGAVEALSQMGTPVIDALIQLLSDISIDSFAAQVLQRIGEPTVEPLIIALQDRDSNVRFWAAYVLGQIGDTKGIVPLKVALNDKDEEVRENAADALKKMGINP